MHGALQSGPEKTSTERNATTTAVSEITTAIISTRPSLRRALVLLSSAASFGLVAPSQSIATLAVGARSLGPRRPLTKATYGPQSGRRILVKKRRKWRVSGFRVARIFLSQEATWILPAVNNRLGEAAWLLLLWLAASLRVMCIGSFYIKERKPREPQGIKLDENHYY